MNLSHHARHMIRITVLATALLAICTAAAAAGAQELGAAGYPHGEFPHSSNGNEIAIKKPANRNAELKGFGTADFSIASYSGIAIEGYRAADNAELAATGGLRYCTDACTLQTQVTLPTGVEIDTLELDLFDDDAAGNVTARFIRCPFNTGSSPCHNLGSTGTTDSDTPGATFTAESGIDHTIDNLDNTYVIQVSLSGGTSGTGVEGIRLWYQRQVSPAPASATFDDVPEGHPFFQHVEALVASGITAGCGGGDFCPDSPLTRGQMAVFLASALGLHWPE